MKTILLNTALESLHAACTQVVSDRDARAIKSAFLVHLGESDQGLHTLSEEDYAKQFVAFFIDTYNACESIQRSVAKGICEPAQSALDCGLIEILTNEGLGLDAIEHASTNELMLLARQEGITFEQIGEDLQRSYSNNIELGRDALEKWYAEQM